MTRAIAGEMLKLRTTRTFYGIVLGTLALVVVISLIASLAADFEGTPAPAADLLSIASLSETFALILGVLAVTTEFRHGTITPTLLVIPRRTRLIAAKVVAHAGAGLVLGVVCFVACAAIVLLILPARDVPTGVTAGETVRTLAGGAAGTALFAVLGVGIGAVLRNQVGAIIAVLAWLFLIEPLLGTIPGLETTVAQYGLGGVGSGVVGLDTGETDLLGQVPAGLVLLGYSAVFLVAGTALLQRRDVSA